MKTLSIQEFWDVRGVIDAHGDDGAAKLLGVSKREICDAIYPGTDDATLEKLRAALRGRRVRQWS